MNSTSAQWLLIGSSLVAAVIIGITIATAPVFAVVSALALAGISFRLRHMFWQPVSVGRPVTFAIILLIAVIIVIRLLSLSHYPTPFYVDEAWNLGFAISFLRDGYLSDLIMEQSTGAPAYSLSWFFPLPALWISITGPEFWNVRLFHYLLLNSALILFVFLAARNWFDQRTAWLSAAVLFASTITLHNALIRHDGALAAAIAAGVWLHTEALKRDHGGLHLLAGFVCGASVLIHLHGAPLALACLAGLYIPHLLASRSKQRMRYLACAGFFLAGIVIAFGIYYLFQYAPDQANYVEVLKSRSMPDLSPHMILLRSLLHFVVAGGYSAVEWYLFVMAIVGCLMRRRLVDLKLFFWFVMMYLALGAVQNEIFSNYIRQMTPVLGLMAGSVLSFGLRRLPEPRNPFITRDFALVTMALGFVLSVNLGPSLASVMQGKPLHLPTPPAVAWVREHIAPDAKILAPSHAYLWLTDYTFTSTYYLWTSQRQVIGGTAVADDERMAIADTVGPEIWDEVNADVVIYDNIEPITAMLPVSLYQSDYLASRGYEQVYEWSGEWNGQDYEARIYVREPEKVLVALRP